MDSNKETTQNPVVYENTKYCKYCGSKIPSEAVICIHCGCQVEEFKHNSQPTIVINNANNNSNSSVNTAAIIGVRAKNKWVSFLLCIFFGYLGAHKFYEGKVGMGLVYLFTGGLFLIGWIVDCIVLFCKPNPYYIH